ncbi:MAG: S-methyl-5'-thioadenosine phosphorylase, partial [Nanoarchaeota archaeon]|nr:S-methyl-5'-thioadenosine phosphorylase [Nanoarchaeota archaeon]
IETKYGKPSSKIACGKISDAEVCILARHGKNHDIPPSQVNYRANIAALKILGCNYVIGTSAVGSLKEEIKPGDLVFPDQFIDFTKQRKNTFYDEIGEVKHTEMAEPFSGYLRKILIQASDELGFKKHDKATIAVIEGPRFSTRAESFMFKNFADIIGMTTVPECILAKEAGLEYASIAMSTDYDCWKEGEESVTFDMVVKRMKDNADKVKKLLVRGIEKIISNDEKFIKSKIRTIPDFPKPGVMFRDITTLIQDAEGFSKTIKIFEDRYKNKEIDLVAGIESRGFVFASALASRLNKGVVLLRKPGKLPYKTVAQEYDTEYSRDKIEVHEDAIKQGEKVLLTDDLLATSGTMVAACNLIKKLGGEIVECACVIELEDLGGRKKLEDKGYNLFSIVKFGGE